MKIPSNNWNVKLSPKLFDIIPSNDALGVLQDVHWSGGLIGYFPTYFLGNLYASQIYDSAIQKIPTLSEDYKKGNFTNLLHYLTENIYQYGKIYSAKELIKRISNQDLNPEYFLKYIQEKYSSIYGI